MHRLYKPTTPFMLCCGCPQVYMIAVRQLGRLTQEDETAFDSIYAHIPYVPLDMEGREQAKVPGMTAFLKAGRALLILGLCQPSTSISASNATRDPPEDS